MRKSLAYPWIIILIVGRDQLPNGNKLMND